MPSASYQEFSTHKNDFNRFKIKTNTAKCDAAIGITDHKIRIVTKRNNLGFKVTTLGATTM